MHAEQMRGGEDMRIEGAVGAGRRDHGDFADAAACAGMAVMSRLEMSGVLPPRPPGT